MGDVARESWTCPLCERRFKIPLGTKLTACPDCQSKPVLGRIGAVSKSSSTQNDWYVLMEFDDSPRGPLPIAEVQALYRQGMLKNKDLAWRGRGGDRLPVSSFPSISSYLTDSIAVHTTETITCDASVVDKYLPLVTSRRVYGINFIAEFFATANDALGGRVDRFEKAIADIERELLDDIRLAAINCGANAVVGFRMQFGELSGHNKFMMFGLAI